MNLLLKNVGSALIHYRKRLPSTIFGFIIRGTRVVWYLKSHNKVSRLLEPFRQKKFVPVKISFIYLFKYLSNRFTTREKLDILIHHYTFLKNNFVPSKLEEIFEKGLTCWTQDADGHRFEMRLTSPTPYEEEGSLALTISMDGDDIYSLAFSFAPGNISTFGKDEIIYISRIQGANGRLDKISKSSKCFSDNNPSTLLIAAMEGIALSLGITRLVGISAENQIGFSLSRQNFYKSYNTFWETYETIQLEGNDYAIDLPIKTKDLTLIKSRRRKRTVKKRGVRLDISASIYSNAKNFIVSRTELSGRVLFQTDLGELTFAAIDK